MTWLGLVPGLLDSASMKGNEGSRARGGGGAVRRIQIRNARSS